MRGKNADDSRANEAFLAEQSRRDAQAPALRKSKEELAATLRAKQEPRAPSWEPR